jgi:DNA-binding GntR family transcriptional regulator
LIVDDVYRQLVTLIMDGHVGPGDSLSIDALAREFHVSSSPLREALARLEGSGLVRRYANRGYRVAPLLTASDLTDLIEARLVLEPVAARRAAAEPGESFLKHLRASVDDLAAAPRGEDFASFRDYLEADQRFHQLISENTGNSFLAHAYAPLGGHMQRFRLFSGAGVTDAHLTIPEHGAVLAAIEARDPEAAAAAMTAHLEGVRARTLEEIAAVSAT